MKYVGIYKTDDSDDDKGPGGAENNNSRNGDHLSSGSVTSRSDDSVSVLRNNRSVKILPFQGIQIQHMNVKGTLYDLYIIYILMMSRFPAYWCER